MHEQMQVVASILLKANGAKAPQLVRWPRPKGALSEILERQRFERHHELVRRLTPER